MSNLKDCPCCCSFAVEICAEYYPQHDDREYYIVCMNCFHETETDPNVGYVINKWNNLEREK